MPVANTLVMETNLNQEHGKHSIQTDMKCDSAIDDDLAPECTILGVYDNGKDGGDLQREHKPALSFLELDQGGGHGHAGPRHGRCVSPD